MSISGELKTRTTSDRVETLLIKYPSARASDKALILLYMKGFHNIEKRIGSAAWNEVKHILFKEMPSFESIRRVRRKFQ